MDNESQASEPVKNVGFEISEKKIDLEGGEVVGKIAGTHVGQLGSLKITLEGKFSALPLINKGIDFLEAKIPGDQKVYAQLLKDAVAKIKL
jgi:hypothetical protein